MQHIESTVFAGCPPELRELLRRRGAGELNQGQLESACDEFLYTPDYRLSLPKELPVDINQPLEEQERRRIENRKRLNRFNADVVAIIGARLRAIRDDRRELADRIGEIMRASKIADTVMQWTYAHDAKRCVIACPFCEFSRMP